MKYFIERKKNTDETYLSEKARKKKEAAQVAKAREGCKEIPTGEHLSKEVQERYEGGMRGRVPKCLENVLKPYQVTGFNWMSRLYGSGNGGILGDDMGLGKTVQAISLIANLVENKAVTGKDAPVLIVVPLSVLGNWCNEFKKFAPDISVLAYTGAKEERQELRDGIEKDLNSVRSKTCYIPGVHCLITTYELLKLDSFFTTAFDYPLCVIDEGHRLKNPKVASIFNTPKSQLGLKHVPVRFLLTGTPLQNNISELWSLLNVVCPVLFNDLESFSSKWFPSIESGDTGAQSDRLTDILSYILLRRTKDKVLTNLPPKTEMTLHCPLSPVQKLLYKGVLQKNAASILGNEKRSLGNIVMQLRKCCNHPYMFTGVEEEPFELGEHLVLNSGKLTLLDKLLTELKKNNHRVLIFSQFTSSLDILQDYLHLRDHSYERLDGSLRASERFEVIDNFSKENVFAFLLSTRAGGLGLNLTCADTVIFFDHDWNPHVDLQAQERVYRIGQAKPVTVYRLVSADSIEDIILSRALKKLQLADGVLNKPQDGKASTAPKNIELLELIKASAATDAAEDEKGTIKDLLVHTPERSEDDAKSLSAYLDFVTGSVREMISNAEVTTRTSERKDKEHMTYEGVDYTGLVKKGEDALKDLFAAASAPPLKPRVEGASQRVVKVRELITPHEKEDNRRKRLKKRWGEAKYTSRQVEPVPGYPDAVDALLKTLILSDKGDEECEDLESPIHDAPYHVQGDATKPRECKLAEEIKKGYGTRDTVDLVIMPVNNSGEWGGRGFFKAVDQLSQWIGSYYEKAKDCQDLRLGDVHLIKVTKALSVALMVSMRSANTAQDFTLLETALKKLREAADKMASRGVHPMFHIPHFGTHSEWYTVQKYLAKYLDSYACFIYYFRPAKRKHPKDDTANKKPRKEEQIEEQPPQPLPGHLMLTSMD